MSSVNSLSDEISNGTAGTQKVIVADMLAKALSHNHFDPAPTASIEQEGLQTIERFQLIIESFPAVVVMTDSSGNIVLLNSRTTETFGYEWEELVGHSIEMLVPQCFGEGEGVNRVEFAAYPGLQRRGNDQELYGVRKDGGEFHVEVTLSPLQVNGTVLVLSIITDITIRKLSEQALIDVNVQLLEANEKIRKMKEQHEDENICLKREIKLAATTSRSLGKATRYCRY